MSKYSSFKSHQLVTENWRNYLSEEDEKPQPEEVVASAKKILASPKGHKAIAKLLKDPEFRKQMDQSLGQEISEGVPDDPTRPARVADFNSREDIRLRRELELPGAVKRMAGMLAKHADESWAQSTAKRYAKFAFGDHKESRELIALLPPTLRAAAGPTTVAGHMAADFSPERLQTSIKNLTGEDLITPAATALSLGGVAATILGGAPALLGAGAALAAIALYRQWKKEDMG